MLQVALTFDYEIFFGENYGTTKEILFDPTERLLETLNQYNVKASFFADVLSVFMHEKYGLNSYCEQYIDQIKRMVAAGHDVQLHIHPNWLTSEFVDGKWDFDTQHYRIHTFGFDRKDQMSVPHMIEWGKAFLEKHLQSVDPAYRCVAYRAGGYCAQPHEKLFGVLNENGIFIDSSVSAMMKADGINVYDYMDVPEGKTGWWLRNDGAISKQVKKENGDTYEVPVGCVSNSLLRRILMPSSERVLQLGTMRGAYIGQNTTATKKKAPNRLSLLLSYGKGKQRLSVDSLKFTVILRGLKKYARKAKGNAYVAVIGHPKLINNIWLENFESFLRKSCEHQKFCFVTMQEIAVAEGKN